MLRIISEYVIIVCLEPEIGHLSPGPGSSVLENVGFISFGDSYIRQAANIDWTASIPPGSTNLKYVLYPGDNYSWYAKQKVFVQSEGVHFCSYQESLTNVLHCAFLQAYR